MKKTILTLISFFALVLFIASCGKDKEEANQTSPDELSETQLITITQKQFLASGMSLGKIENHQFEETISVTGQIDVACGNKYNITAYYPGYVEELKVCIGDSVRKGQLLFTLSNPDYIKLQEEYLALKSKIEYLKEEYERQEKLFADSVASKKKYLQAKSEYFSAKSRLQSVEQQLKMLNISLSDIEQGKITSVIGVYAPAKGYITDIYVNPGQFIQQETTVLRLVNTSHYHIKLNVFEKDINKIRKGQKIYFYLPDNPHKIYEGTIFHVGKALNDKRIVLVQAHINKGVNTSGFIPGMFVEARIVTGMKEAPALPSTAVVDLDDKFYVLLLKEKKDGKYIFEQKNIQIGDQDDKYTEILNADDFPREAQFLTNGAFALIKD